MTERAFVSDNESYAIFVGSLTATAFVEDYDSIDDAVDDFFFNYPWDEEPPSWLRESLIRYLKKELMGGALCD